MNIPNKRPRIIEIVGVAGTGKSTLRKAMTQRNERIKPFRFPGNISYMPFLVKMVATFYPLYLRKYRHDRWFTIHEIRNMGYLDTWLSRLRLRSLFRNNIYIIEPGSVYWLSNLQGHGPEITRHPRFQHWWNQAMIHWSSALEAIIWLDAPTDTCFQRISSRDEWHQYKFIPPEKAISLLKFYREYYERLIPQMASLNALKVLTFRSDQMSTEQITDRIFSELDLKA